MARWRSGQPRLSRPYHGDIFHVPRGSMRQQGVRQRAQPPSWISYCTVKRVITGIRTATYSATYPTAYSRGSTTHDWVPGSRVRYAARDGGKLEGAAGLWRLQPPFSRWDAHHHLPTRTRRSKVQISPLRSIHAVGDVPISTHQSFHVTRAAPEPSACKRACCGRVCVRRVGRFIVKAPGEITSRATEFLAGTRQWRAPIGVSPGLRPHQSDRLFLVAIASFAA